MKTPAVKVHLSHCVVSVNKPGRQMGCGTDQWGKKTLQRPVFEFRWKQTIKDKDKEPSLEFSPSRRNFTCS